jgi:hypothetical protein
VDVPKFPARFKNTAEMEAYLSVLEGRDGDRRRLVQRLLDGTLAQEEKELLAKIASGKIAKRVPHRPPKAMDQIRRDTFAMAVLIEERFLAPRFSKGSVRKLAIENVRKRGFYGRPIGRTKAYEAVRRFECDRKKKAFAQQYIDDQFAFLEKFKRDPESFDPESFDFDARMILAKA